MQQRQADFPAGLFPAVLARNFVQAALQPLAEPEILRTDCEYLAAGDRIVNPFRECDLHCHHTMVIGILFHDLPTVDQGEALHDAFGPGFDVGLDVGRCQTIQGLLELFIAFAAGLAVGGYQQIMGGHPYRAGHVAMPSVQRFHHLADAINQNILVPDGRQPVGAWRNREAVAVVFVMPDPVVRLGG